MSSEIIWSILGVTVSGIFGILGIYLTIKSRYPGKITYVNEQTIELFDTVGNSIDGLAVTYDNSDVNENLVLLNGAFINSGKTDITKEMVEKPITLSLPEGYKWLSGSIVGSNVTAELELNQSNNILIKTGLFRCGESVRFHALAQLPDNDDGVSNSKKLNNSLKFEHRITNTKKIDETVVQPKDISKKAFKRKALPFGLMFIFLIGASSYILYKGLPKTVVYPYQIDNNIIENVTVKVTHEDLIEIKSITSKFETEESFSDFLTKVKGSPALADHNSDLKFILTLGLQGIILLIMLSLPLFEYMRNRRLLKLINPK